MRCSYRRPCRGNDLWRLPLLLLSAACRSRFEVHCAACAVHGEGAASTHVARLTRRAVAIVVVLIVQCPVRSVEGENRVGWHANTCGRGA